MAACLIDGIKRPPLRVRRLVAYGSRIQCSIQHGRLRAASVADFVSANKRRQPIGYRLDSFHSGAMVGALI